MTHKSVTVFIIIICLNTMFYVVNVVTLCIFTTVLLNNKYVFSFFLLNKSKPSYSCIPTYIV